MSTPKPLRVLVCPLNWGLGHATRCIPVIKELQQLGCEVMIASSGDALELLRIEFPQVKFFSVPSYGISYSRSLPLVVHLALKAPKILAAIRKEHREIQKLVEEHAIDFIISDNRYGCYHHKIPTAIIIHQLTIKLPRGWGWMSGIVNKYNAKFISRFTHCWVPDLPDHQLSGELSVNDSIKHDFIGALSRMTPLPATERIAILCLISGPEPHRTALETLLTAELSELGTNFSYRIVRGLPGASSDNDSFTFNHLPASQLNQLICNADLVVSRPGYSTIMDLAALSKKAIFIPTPGQSEQLYLAESLHEKKICMMIQQDFLMLSEQLRNINNFTGFPRTPSIRELLTGTLRNFLKLK